jgi:hypothetical protein
MKTHNEEFKGGNVANKRRRKARPRAAGAAEGDDAPREPNQGVTRDNDPAEGVTRDNDPAEGVTSESWTDDDDDDGDGNDDTPA